MTILCLPIIIEYIHTRAQHQATVSCILVSDENTSSTPMREGGLHYPLFDDVISKFHLMTTIQNAPKIRQKYKKDQVLLTVYCEIHCNTPSLCLFIYISLVNNFATEYNMHMVK